MPGMSLLIFRFYNTLNNLPIAYLFFKPLLPAVLPVMFFQIPGNRPEGYPPGKTYLNLFIQIFCIFTFSENLKILHLSFVKNIVIYFLDSDRIIIWRVGFISYLEEPLIEFLKRVRNIYYLLLIVQLAVVAKYGIK